MKKKENIYTKLTIDLQTVNGVMIEKYVEPSVVNDFEIIWYDKNELLHSFNGFPSYIEKRLNTYHICWHNHGEYIKSLSIIKKLSSEIIAEKIAKRNFSERVKNKLNKK